MRYVSRNTNGKVLIDLIGRDIRIRLDKDFSSRYVIFNYSEICITMDRLVIYFRTQKDMKKLSRFFTRDQRVGLYKLYVI